MNDFAGTIPLTRLAARRDRFVLPAWVLGLTVFTGATTAMLVQSLAKYEDLVQETELVANNPGLRMLGLASGASVGAYTMHRDYVTLAVLAALMSILAVVRHTRQNEERGCADVVGATVVGRYAGLAAAVIVTVGANVVLGVTLSLAMMVNGQPVSGCIAAGAAVAAVGVAFVGVAASTSQLASTTRGAIGASGAALGMAFLLSGIGNMLGTADRSTLRVTSAWPVWLSPIGWGQQMRPFGGDRWWPLGLFAVLFGCLLTLAVVLAGRRDVGAGVWPQRPGHARAGAALLSPVGLVWRLQRGALLGWAVGLLGFGLIFGAVSGQIQDVQGNAREWYVRMGGSAQVLDAYRTSIVEMAGMAVAIYVVQILLRLRADETEGTIETVLASGVSRSRWVAAYVMNAVVGAALLVLVFAVGMGLAAGQVLGGTTTQVRELVAAGIVQLPAILVIGAVVITAVGLLPRWAATVSWSMFLMALMVGPLFGPSLGLAPWMQVLSPFTHTPKAPATGVDVAPLVVLAFLCLALGVTGLAAVRRRDVLVRA